VCDLTPSVTGAFFSKGIAMALWLATKTLQAIHESIARDGGAAFRKYEQQVLPHMKDAYDQEKEQHRSHLGASVLGQECERAIAYSFLWASPLTPRGRKDETPLAAQSRMRRLWNRGHLEEARFISMLLSAGICVYQQDAQGRQYRIYDLGGHVAGSLDGVLVNVPDLPVDTPALGEYKTHSAKSFAELVDEGVRLAKPQHYVQMNQYMGHMCLSHALYLAVNKDTEDLHAEIIPFDGANFEQFRQRGQRIVFGGTLPERIRGASPGYYVCRYMCDHKDVCFSTLPALRNCRTCRFSSPVVDGTWVCQLHRIALDKETQRVGCSSYKVRPDL
jgi:hypothetical protein